MAGVFIVLGILTGCNTGKISNDNQVSQGAGLLDEFIIMAYSGPPPSELTYERFREIAEAGIEILVPGNGIYNKELNLKVMDLAEKVGIRIIPFDLRLQSFSLTPDVSVDSSLIKMVVNDYKDSPALAGYVIKDEPNAGMFIALKKISELFREYDSTHEPLINLLPSYGSPLQLGFENYRDYIASFIDEVKPRLLSYDNYALRVGFTGYEAWYNDLTIVREETRRVKIPFMVFIQSEGIRGAFRVPNRDEILWQINSALAYGARGFGWFCYWTPKPDQSIPKDKETTPLIESHYHAMIDSSGNKTSVYSFVSEANSYLKIAGRGLLDWSNTDVARFEEGKLNEGGSSPVVFPIGNQANLVIGTYRHNSKCRVVISNSRCDESSVFSLNIQPAWKLDSIFSSINTANEGDSASFSGWILKPGGSVILDLKPSGDKINLTKKKI